MQWIENSEDVKEYSDRFPLILGTLLVVVGIFVLRLFTLQIINGAEFYRFSEQNRVKEEKRPAPRGTIYDRNGEVLIQNQLAFDAIITPQYLANLDQVAETAARILSLKKETIVDSVKKSRKLNGVFRPVRIKENITRDEVIKLERIIIDYPGLEVIEGIKRNYLLGENGAQVFGYTGEISKLELPIYNEKDSKFSQGDLVGKAGLEKKWDHLLRGIDGAKFSEVDARGREIPSGSNLLLGGDPVEVDYTPGKNMYLTLDKDVQLAAYQAMKSRDRMGGVVAMDPNTGEVLAMVNTPSYDPNDFTAGIPPEIWSRLINDPFKPLRNKMIQDHYPPASTFKAVVAIAALEEKIVTPQTTYSCSGFLKFGNRSYHCWLKHGHGSISMRDALARSCDVYFYRLGLALGVDKIAKYARRLGIGTKSGIDLEGEKTGLMPDSEWKQRTIGEPWQAGENLSITIGQGFMLVTPLQLNVAYAALGSGKRVHPYVVRKIEDLDGKPLKVFEPISPDDILKADSSGTQFDEKSLSVVREGLSMVVNGPHGTAGSGKFKKLEMAGKTGTAQLFQIAADKIFDKCENRPVKQRHHGWFTAFAPKEHPLIAVTVFSEHACHGSVGAPIAHDIILAFMKKYHPEMVEDEELKVQVKVVNEGEE